jgi:hypothetical protein
LCSVRVFSTSCDSALTTSIVSKWQVFSFIFSRGNRKVGWVGDEIHVFGKKKFPDETEVWDGAILFVAKVWGEVFTHFHAVTVKRHSSTWNLMFGLTGRILCEQSHWCQRKWACSWLSIGRIVALYQGYNCKSALVTSDNPGWEGCIIGGDLAKLLAGIDTLLPLISCQKLHQARYTTSNKGV